MMYEDENFTRNLKMEMIFQDFPQHLSPTLKGGNANSNTGTDKHLRNEKAKDTINEFWEKNQ